MMILPFISAISRDVFEAVPHPLKEAAYALGSTTWEVVWRVVLPYARGGVTGGAMLALGRALGETMAVTFVIGNAHHISASLLAPATTISATIANEFTEAVGDIYTSSLVELALILFLVTFIVLALAQLMLRPAGTPGRGPLVNRSFAIYGRRRARNLIFLGLSLAATAIGLTVLGIILGNLLYEGFSGVSPSLFTESTPPPPGNEGGLINAIVGSLIMTGIAVAIGTPIGLFAGTYLAEHGRYTRLAFVVRFVNDIMLSAPSIVLGLFIYEVMVVPKYIFGHTFGGHFSAWAGAVALATIVIPVVVRTTEGMLLLIPNTLREAAAALGAPRSHVIAKVTWRAARAGIVTGALLAIARISGETAPLLFTSLNSQFWSTDLNAPMASLPIVIFQFAMSPYEGWHQLAWAGAVLITMAVLVLSILARALERPQERR